MSAQPEIDLKKWEQSVFSCGGFCARKCCFKLCPHYGEFADAIRIPPCLIWRDDKFLLGEMRLCGDDFDCFSLAMRGQIAYLEQFVPSTVEDRCDATDKCSYGSCPGREDGIERFSKGENVWCLRPECFIEFARTLLNAYRN